MEDRLVADNSGKQIKRYNAPALEGPFLYRSGRILYYDRREDGGTYYDPTIDMYLTNEEAQRVTSAGVKNNG